MTVHEVKERIRAYIEERHEERMPEWVYANLWQMHKENLQELAQENPEESDWELIGYGYLMAAETLYRLGVPHHVATCSHSHRATSEEQIPRAELIEKWWQVLPERDRQAVEAVWEFGYNVLERYAERFRKDFTGGKTLSPHESEDWITSPKNGCLMSWRLYAPEPHRDYLLSPESLEWVGDNHTEGEGTIAFGDYSIFFSWQDRHSPLGRLHRFAMANHLQYGVPLHCIMKFVLTGVRMPARLLGVVISASTLESPRVMPLFPEYLSAEGVARVWQTVRFPKGAKSWALSRFRIAGMKSYVQACQVWNEVAPESWRIANYRHFRRDWIRANPHGARPNKEREDVTVDCFEVVHGAITHSNYSTIRVRGYIPKWGWRSPDSQAGAS